MTTAIPASLQPYAGREPRIDDPIQRMAYQLQMLQSAAFYGPHTCDWALKAAQLVLNEKTADYLYSGFSPTTVRYAPGSRPVLEKLARRLTADARTDRDKVLAILDYIYRGYRADHVDLFPDRNVTVLNAQEEEIPKLGHVSCECHSRLTICLCNVIGLPARYVGIYGWVDPDRAFAFTSGHTMTEVYLDGHWSAFDSDWGFFCLLADGRPASVWELLADPSLIDRQPDWVYNSFGNKRAWHTEYQNTFLSPRSVRGMANYSVNDWVKYDWNWIVVNDDPADPHLRKVTRERDQLHQRLINEYRAAHAKPSS